MTQEHVTYSNIASLACQRAEKEIELLAVRINMIRIYIAANKKDLPGRVKQAIKTIDDGMLTLRLRTRKMIDAVEYLETYFDIDLDYVA